MTEQYVFAGFVGVLLATLFAAIMSICDSQLLVIASSFVRDFRARRDRLAGGILRSRLAVLFTLALAVALTFGDVPLVNDLVLLSWAALGAAFGPALLLLLYDARTTARGVLALGGGGVGVLGGPAREAHRLRADRRLPPLRRRDLEPASAVATSVTWSRRSRAHSWIAIGGARFSHQTASLVETLQNKRKGRNEVDWGEWGEGRYRRIRAPERAARAEDGLGSGPSDDRIRVHEGALGD